MAYRNNYDDLLKDIQASGQSWSTYDLDLAKSNPDAGRSIYTQKLAYANAQTDAERQAANDAAEMIRRQYGGYTGGKSGAGFTLTGKNTANQAAPSYTQYASKYQSQIDDLMAQLGGTKYNSQYQGQIDDLMGQIMNRDPFSYTPTDDPSYAAYAEHYRNAGNQAREDTLAQAAAMVGGQPSSYAVAAAQQAQNAYNAQMSDIIPQLRDAAYGMYMDEGNTMRNNLSSLMALEQDAYGKYLDEADALRYYISALQGMDDTAYNRHQDAYNNQFAEWEANYGVSRDAIEDARYDQEWDLTLRQEAAKAAGGTVKEEYKPLSTKDAIYVNAKEMFENGADAADIWSYLVSATGDEAAARTYAGFLGLEIDEGGLSGPAAAMNTSHFNASMSSIVAQLQAGKFEAALDNADRMMTSYALSEEQSQKLNELLEKYLEN